MSAPTVSPVSGSCFSFGVFTIDLRARKLLRGSDAVPLPARAFDSLAYLVTNAGQPLDKNEIISAAWRDVAVTDDSLIHAISVIRRALGDDPEQPSFIETIPRFGYRFVTTVVPLGEHPPAAEQQVPVANGAGAAEVSRGKVRRWREALAIGCLMLAVIGLTVWVLGSMRHPPPAMPNDGRVVRLDQLAPAGTTIVSGGAVSPTGTHLAFVALDDATGETAVWVRALHSTEMIKLAGTARASRPFWSPDGGQIAFFSNGNLSAVNLSGEPARTIAAVGPTAIGGSWGGDDMILFADWTKGIYAVSARGGSVRRLTHVDHSAPEFVHAWPQLLPDGRHFLYQIVTIDPSRAGVYIGAIGSQQSVRLIDGASPAVYVSPGYLLYIRHDMLMAEGFDASRLTLDGRPAVLARGVSILSWQHADVVSGSRDVIAFRESHARQRLRVVDRAGEEQQAFDAPTRLMDIRLSPDGKQLIGMSSIAEPPELWSMDLTLLQHTRLAPDAISPVWAPDGARLAFTARGGLDLYIRPTAGADVGPIISDRFVKVLNDWTPDGRELVFSQLDPETKLDLWIWSPTRGPTPLLRSRHSEMQARISPDGRWIAYVSDASGAAEVHVARYPQLTGMRRLSVSGGAQPQWRRDQSEFFYLSLDNALMVVPITAGMSFGTPRRLFRTTITGHAADVRDSYVVSSDGQSFVFEGPPEISQTSHISVVLNWTAALMPPAAQKFGLSRFADLRLTSTRR